MMIHKFLPLLMIATHTHAASDPSDDLPTSWGKHTDPTGKPYYQNHANQKTTWDKPVKNCSAKACPFLANMEYCSHCGCGEWESCLDQASGKSYWKNHRTKNTSWEGPVTIIPAGAPRYIPIVPNAYQNKQYVEFNENAPIRHLRKKDLMTYYVDHLKLRILQQDEKSLENTEWEEYRYQLHEDTEYLKDLAEQMVTMNRQKNYPKQTPKMFAKKSDVWSTQQFTHKVLQLATGFNENDSIRNVADDKILYHYYKDQLRKMITIDFDVHNDKLEQRAKELRIALAKVMTKISRTKDRMTPKDFFEHGYSKFRVDREIEWRAFYQMTQ